MKHFKLHKTDGGLYIPEAYLDSLLPPKVAISKFRETVPFMGRFTFAVWDAKSLELVAQASTTNLITDAGKAKVIDRVWSNAPGARSINFIAVGDGTTTPTASDTALENQLGSKQITLSRDNTNLTGSTPYTIATVIFTTAEANGEITEGGLLFDDSSICTHALMSELGITGATQASPVRITSTGHGLVDSQRVTFKDVGGMVELNGNSYYIDQIDANTFDLYSDEALTSPINGTGFTAYTSGGSWVLTVLKDATKVGTATYQFGAS